MELEWRCSECGKSTPPTGAGFMRLMTHEVGHHTRLVNKETGEILASNPKEAKAKGIQIDVKGTGRKGHKKKGKKKVLRGDDRGGAGGSGNGGDHHWVDDIPAVGTTTPIIDEAQAVEYTPRVLKADYTPIMRSARSAATREWGWPADMPWEDFLDTCLFIIFNDRDIVLTGYSIRSKNGGD